MSAHITVIASENAHIHDTPEQMDRQARAFQVRLQEIGVLGQEWTYA